LKQCKANGVHSPEFVRTSGVITTPGLRNDGSLMALRGFLEEDLRPQEEIFSFLKDIMFIDVLLSLFVDRCCCVVTGQRES
jgi:hypothetical protein